VEIFHFLKHEVHQYVLLISHLDIYALVLGLARLSHYVILLWLCEVFGKNIDVLCIMINLFGFSGGRHRLWSLWHDIARYVCCLDDFAIPINHLVCY